MRYLLGTVLIISILAASAAADTCSLIPTAYTRVWSRSGLREYSPTLGTNDIVYADHDVVTRSDLPSTPSLANQIDQNQPSATSFMAGFDQIDLAQSFQQTHTNISGAGINLYVYLGSTDTVTIQLWENGLPNASGTMLTEASAIGTAGQWVDVFWTPVPVVPGTTYYLVFTGNTTLGINGDSNNPYPYGCVYANPGYNQFANYDYTFRTYYDNTVSLERYSWAEVKTFFNQ